MLANWFFGQTFCPGCNWLSPDPPIACRIRTKQLLPHLSQSHSHSLSHFLPSLAVYPSQLSLLLYNWLWLPLAIFMPPLYSYYYQLEQLCLSLSHSNFLYSTFFHFTFSISLTFMTNYLTLAFLAGITQNQPPTKTSYGSKPLRS